MFADLFQLFIQLHTRVLSKTNIQLNIDRAQNFTRQISYILSIRHKLLLSADDTILPKWRLSFYLMSC